MTTPADLAELERAQIALVHQRRAELAAGEPRQILDAEEEGNSNGNDTGN